MRSIVAVTYGGFGNKIFDIITALYVQHVGGGNIYIYTRKTIHDNVDDKTILDIFPNLSSKITILNEKSEIYDIMNKISKKKRTIINCENIKSENDLNISNKYKFIWIKQNFVCYKYMYEIYNKLKDDNNDLFRINTNIISKNTQEISKTNYMIIHIRYGDKLEMASDGDNTWVVYAPIFYKKIIQKYAKKTKIYIITDDVKIVKEFILNDVSLHNVEILDIPYWEALYCLTKSRYTVLNISTFSMLGSLLNEKLKKGFIVTRSTDPKLSNNKKTPEENIIPNTKWMIINNDEYILNHNKHLMKKMLEFKNKI
jgi:hypothetical protein